MRVLVVTNPFRGFGIGDRITDPALIDEIRGGEHAQHAVLTDHPDVPEAEPSVSKPKK